MQRNSEETQQLVSEIASRERRGITIEIERSHDWQKDSDLIRKGVVRKIEQQQCRHSGPRQRCCDAWYVELSAPPLPGLSNNVTQHIFLSQIVRVVK